MTQELMPYRIPGKVAKLDDLIDLDAFDMHEKKRLEEEERQREVNSNRAKNLEKVSHLQGEIIRRWPFVYNLQERVSNYDTQSQLLYDGGIINEEQCERLNKNQQKIHLLKYLFIAEQRGKELNKITNKFRDSRGIQAIKSEYSPSGNWKRSPILRQYEKESAYDAFRADLKEVVSVLPETLNSLLEDYKEMAQVKGQFMPRKTISDEQKEAIWSLLRKKLPGQIESFQKRYDGWSNSLTDDFKALQHDIRNYLQIIDEEMQLRKDLGVSRKKIKRIELDSHTFTPTITYGIIFGK